MATDTETTQPSYEDTILRRQFQRWEACGDPPAWAQFRDAATRGLPWFHVVQGGVDLTSNNPDNPRYSSPVYVTGILIDGYSALNSYIDSEVIITSLHGSQKEVDETASVPKRRIDALKATFDNRKLVGCLIGNGATKPGVGGTSTQGNKRKMDLNNSTFFACPMPKNQNCWVLGFYIITDTWEARTEDGWVTMLRLERWNLQEKAWFASKSETHNPPQLTLRNFGTTAPGEECQTCEETSPRMFEDFFLCRRKECSDFWKHNGEKVTANLTYTKEFLQQRTSRTNPPKSYALYEGSSEFPEVAPSFLPWWEENYNSLKDRPITKEDFQKRMTALNHGFHCPDCGMLNRRVEWHEWKCALKDCGFSRAGQPMVIPAAKIVEFDSGTEPEWSKLPCFERKENTSRYIKYHYDLSNDCKVTVMMPKAKTNAMEHGSDWLWNEFQRQANDGTLGLQRQFIHTMSGGTITNHFVANFGEEYKLTVGISQTKSFDEAPSIITTAKDAANRECRQYQSSQGQEDFNECYVAGYFTDNVMHWHNDGETGLGSVIATWTLGGEGRMSFCPDLDQYWGQSKSGKFIEEDFLLPGVKYEAERRVLKETLDRKRPGHGGPNHKCRGGCQTALEEWKEAFKALFKNVKRGSSAGPRKWLTFPLVHGSIVVMHGKNMQKHFVHEVSVATPLRFALTFRHISEEHSENAKSSKKVVFDYPHIPDTSYLEEFREEVSEGGAKKKKTKK